jgi:DNA-binding response OmpR family regulator
MKTSIHRKSKMRQGRLVRKYVVVFTGLVSGALLASGLIEIYFSYQDHKTALAALQREKALAAALRIEQFIKQNPALRHIPIMAVTSYALSGDEEKALEAGCEAYVSKPFSPRVVLAKIHEYLP